MPKHPVTGKHAAVAILFSEPTRIRDGLEMKPLWLEVKGYSFLETFTTNEGIFYGGRSFLILPLCSSRFAMFQR